MRLIILAIVILFAIETQAQTTVKPNSVDSTEWMTVNTAFTNPLLAKTQSGFHFWEGEEGNALYYIAQKDVMINVVFEGKPYPRFLSSKDIFFLPIFLKNNQKSAIVIHTDDDTFINITVVVTN